MSDFGSQTPSEHRRMLYEVSAAIAPGWERQRARVEQMAAPVREWMLRALAPQAGQTILELAAGAGDTGFEAAALVGERGRLISTDLTPAMVEVARRRGASLGLRNVDYVAMDAEHIALDTDSVDGVLCRFGYMLMVDTAAALAQSRRVLRSGGRLALAVWGQPERNPWLTIAGRTLVERGHMPEPDPAALNPFRMGSEEHTRHLLHGAGFSDVRAEEVAVSFTYRDVDDYLTYVGDTAGPLGLIVQRLSGDECETVKWALAKAFSPFEADGGYRVPGLALAAVAS